MQTASEIIATIPAKHKEKIPPEINSYP